MFKKSVLNVAKKHAESSYPKESCGLVVDDKYVRTKNVAKDPENCFAISRDRLKKFAGKIQAVIHSHPDGNYFPSRADMKGQIASAVPWGIVHVQKGVARDPFFWGDQMPVPDLKGRPFQHGVTDCYSLVRDYYRLEKNILLDEFPRDWEWWLDPQFNLYEQNFKSQKFRIIDDAEVREGDCFLAQIRSKVINHAGVYVGRGLILHQLGHRSGFSTAYPSCEQPVQMWKKFIRYWVRHDG
ncbi:hypothetical protein TDB9533_01226 [Thalassocella blandensis]|nr:hypothetical protein TDB9533_01226 [Thalassocella blandensis]